MAEARRHRFWRPGPFPKLTTPEHAARVLDAWRAPVERRGSPPVTVVDITKRHLDDALFELGGRWQLGLQLSQRPSAVGLIADGDRGRRRRLGELLELDELTAERDKRGTRHLEAANAERNADDRQAQERPEDQVLEREPVGCTYSIFLQIGQIRYATEFVYPTR